MLAAEAEREEARVAMLNKQAQEAMQSTQLFDAEADEATAYMSMFGADAKQAAQRLQMESNKLQVSVCRALFTTRARNFAVSRQSPEIINSRQVLGRPGCSDEPDV